MEIKLDTGYEGSTGNVYPVLLTKPMIFPKYHLKCFQHDKLIPKQRDFKPTVEPSLAPENFSIFDVDLQNEVYLQNTGPSRPTKVHVVFR